MANNYKKQNQPNNPNFIQGYFKPKNPDKYIGDINSIIYRSSWEFKFCKYCDLTEDIIRWCSEPDFEPFPIKYWDPIRNKIKQYYVDFYIRLNQDGVEKDFIVEVKPKKMLEKPEPIKGPKTQKKLKNYNYLLESYIINHAKYESAQIFAKNTGFDYIIITEDFLDKNVTI